MHHYPAEPGAIRSIFAPHMFVAGTYRDMLQADVKLARSILAANEADQIDAVAEWMASTGTARAINRRTALMCIERFKLARTRQREAFTRLCEYVAATQQRAA